MTARNAAQIATLIGILLDVENGDTDGIICAPHLQVKVKVDTSKPLAPGFLFPRSGRSPIWVQFLYERLADYCVLYGLVDHRQNFCPAPPPQGPEDKYGISLRAFFFFFFFFQVHVLFRLLLWLFRCLLCVRWFLLLWCYPPTSIQLVTDLCRANFFCKVQ
jgi:hypothetical protein